MLDVLSTVQNPNKKLQAVKADLQCDVIRTLLQCFGLFYVKVTGPYWNLVTSGAVPYLLLFRQIQSIAEYLQVCRENPSKLLSPEGHWEETDEYNITDIPYKQHLLRKLFKIKNEDIPLLHQLIKIVSAAMLRCIEKQLVDFLPGGQFSENPCPKDLKMTQYAHSTNLSCEHHFGDLDSSQKRRPNASMHHHSTVQLIKRNRKPMMKWLTDMDEAEKHEIMKKARKGGRSLRKKHIDSEKLVIQEIHQDMINEKNQKKSRKRKRNDISENEPQILGENELIKDILPVDEQFKENEYVIVAYQDRWYPGCVQKTSGQQIVVNFMGPTRKPGHFIWPARQDVQTVCCEFVIKRNFIPECLNSGRLWKINDSEAVEALYRKYCKVYFQ